MVPVNLKNVLLVGVDYLLKADHETRTVQVHLHQSEERVRRFHSQYLTFMLNDEDAVSEKDGMLQIDFHRGGGRMTIRPVLWPEAEILKPQYRER